MKKNTLLIIIGGILLVAGALLFVLRKEKPVSYTYVEQKLTKDEAIALIKEKAKSVVDVFEKKEDVFKVETLDDNSYYLVSNFSDVVNNLYTENGLAELKNTTFDNNNFIKEEDGKIYILKDIPSNNSYLNSTISVEITSILLKEITGKVSFSSNGVDENGTLTYYVYEKNIKLVKNDDKWLIDTFKYNN